MAEFFYSYSFDLEDGLIREEILGSQVVSPIHAAGCHTPIDFDDFVDIWKSLCCPVFANVTDEKKLTRSYFREAYERGEDSIVIDVEHNPLQNTLSAKYTRVTIKLVTDEKTKRPRAVVLWENIPEHVWKERA